MAARSEEVLPASLTHRRTLVEGLLMACGTPRGHDAALVFLGRRGENVRTADLRQLLADERKAVLEAEQDYLRANGPGARKGTFHGMHGVQRAAKKRALKPGKGAGTCVHCGSIVVPDATVCPNCQKPPAYASGTSPVGTGFGSTTFVPNEPGVVLAEATKPAAKRPARPSKPAAKKPGAKPAEQAQAAHIGRGEVSQRVQHAQQRLQELLPGEQVPTHGRYDATTEKHVKTFQKKQGLEPHGKIDMPTVERMRDPEPEQVTLDPDDRAGIRAFQKEHGLAVTGQLSDETRGALKALNGTGADDEEPDGKTPAETDDGPMMVRRGDGMAKGQPDENVSEVQQLLEDLGYDLGATGVDGRFGESTDKAVREFQLKSGLRVDGVVSDLTYQALLKASKAAEKEAASKEEEKVQEASYTGIGTTGGEMGSMVPWGGANGGAVGQPPVVPGTLPDPADETRVPSLPPGLGPMTGWSMCGNCVHFNGKERCLKHAWPVSKKLVCMDHFTNTPEAQRHYGQFLLSMNDIAEAVKAHDGAGLARARARREFFLGKLTEAGWPLEEMWSPASRAAALAARRNHHHSLPEVAERRKQRPSDPNDANTPANRARRTAIQLKYGSPRRTIQASRPQTWLEEAADSMMKATVHEPLGKPGGPGLWKHKGMQLPAYIQHIAKDIHEKRGVPLSQAIAIAVGAVKRWARGGGKVDAGTRAAAQKAVAEWESKKAEAHAKTAAKKGA